MMSTNVLSVSTEFKFTFDLQNKTSVWLEGRLAVS